MTVLARALSMLPLAVLYRLGGLVYFLVYHVLRVRRGVVQSNLARAFPGRDAADIRELERRIYRNYADVLVEMLHSLRMDEAALRSRIEFSGDEALEAELQGGQPVLLTLAHQCNLEWMLLAACLRFEYPVEVVYRPLSDPGMEGVTTRAYTRFGGVLIDDRSVIKAIMERRRIPRIVTLVSDQAPNVKDEVHWTMFLNQETGFFLAPEIIARFTDYPVYFAAMRRRSRGYYTVELTRIAQPPYKGGERTVVDAYVRAVEQQILDSPEDWLWLHRRWKRQRSMYETTSA